MNTESSWVGVTVAPSPADRQIDEMVADPVGYFTRARQQARREARQYVQQRIRRSRPA